MIKAAMEQLCHPWYYERLADDVVAEILQKVSHEHRAGRNTGIRFTDLTGDQLPAVPLCRAPPPLPPPPANEGVEGGAALSAPLPDVAESSQKKRAQLEMGTAIVREPAQLNGYSSSSSQPPHMATTLPAPLSAFLPSSSNISSGNAPS